MRSGTKVNFILLTGAGWQAANGSLRIAQGTISTAHPFYTMPGVGIG
jgi:hypothetical protein